MYIEEHGPANGAPITFLHGALVGGWDWLAQTAALSDYRCLLPDLPGVGRSADVPWVSLAHTADQIAGMIRARCAGGSTHLVGLSLGGVLALHVAARCPDTVRSLLVSGVTHAPAPALLRLFSSLATALYGRPWGARLIAGVLGIPTANFRELFVQTAVQTNPDALRAALAEVHRHPLPDGLAHVAVPTLAVVGAHDSALARRAVPYLVGVMPNAVGYLVPDAGRRWNARRPRLFADMVWAWVERRQAATPLRRIKPL